MLQRSLLNAAYLMVLTALLAACGPNTKFIKTAYLHAYDHDGERYGEISATVQSGFTSVAATQLQIPDPKDPRQSLGSVQVRNTPFRPSTDLIVNLNLTQLLRTRGSTDTYLPNGASIPLSGVQSASLHSYQIGSGTSRLYTSINPTTQTALIGFALTIENFTHSLTTQIFHPLHFDRDGLDGVIGIYTSPRPAQSGVALFADVSSLLTGISTSQMQEGEFTVSSPPEAERRALENLLFGLHSGHAKLIVH